MKQNKKPTMAEKKKFKKASERLRYKKEEKRKKAAAKLNKEFLLDGF